MLHKYRYLTLNFTVHFRINMKVEKAIEKDLDQLYQVIRCCAQHLIKNGVFQWNETYPSKEILQKDIDLQQIWKLEENNLIVGLIVLTEIEDKEYKNVQWKTKNGNNLYVHRLAVHPKFQGRGFAQKLMDFAESYAIKNKYNSVRLDTFSQNNRNLKFYKKRNYAQLEEIYFPNQSSYPFYCFELILNE